MEICTKITGWEDHGETFLIHTDKADVKLCFVTDEVIRLRASFDRVFPEESYVLMLTAWEDRLDPLFEGERERIAPVRPGVEERNEKIIFTTACLRLEMEKDPFSFALFDAGGTELYRALALSPFTRDTNGRVTHYSRMEADDCFYGFGEKGGRLNKNGEFLRMRATDAMGYDPTVTDTLYKHIPFYIRLSRQNAEAIGVFYHNFHESVFNMGREISNYWPRYSYWQADGGDIDLFLIGGGRVKRIIDNYTRLTGRPVLLPKRALGYQGSSMYYAELEKDSDKAVLSFVDTAREEGFPIDGFHLSSGYTSWEGKRCVFTWNHDRFPDPPGFFAAMNDAGAQCVPNVKPGILLSHPRFAEFEAEGVFIRDSENPSRCAVGRWWGGPGAFWDLTNPAARGAWKKHLTEDVLRVGTDSVWNDNCEYDSLPDKDARVDFDGKGSTVGALKALMSTLLCKTGAEAVEELHPNSRPYIVCRSGSAGIQRYAQTWCGDNFTSWESLRYGIPILSGVGLSGQPNEGADIGGFAGDAPEEELFVRWVQNGIFQPRFSIHSASGDNTVTEPWMYERSANIIREAICFRYRLMPYLYSAEYEASQTGAPILRPLVYEFQSDPCVWDESFTFLFGRDILVANVLEPGATTRKVYLPAGTKWYDWANDFRCYEGGQTVEVPVTLSSIPLFLRQGAIIPMAENQPMNMQRDAAEALHLILIPDDGESSFLLYDDDGVTNTYREGNWRKTLIHMSGKKVVEVAFTAEGVYPDPVMAVTVEMVHRDRSPLRVEIGGRVLQRFLNRRRFEAAEEGWYYSQTRRAALIRYRNPKADCTLTVSFEDFDLIGM